QRTPCRGEGDWPVRVDERTLEDPEHWIQSACVLCSNGCALDIGVKRGRIVVMTETARLADVVLPCAIWGEKTGTFTNVDRTVHISHKAVEPPGEARSDFDIWLDYARRMDFRDKDGAPLIKWTTPEEAFEAWKECSRGRP